MLKNRLQHKCLPVNFAKFFRRPTFVENLQAAAFGNAFFYINRGLHCAIYSTFTPHFMCWIYFDENFMDKNLLHISLTKFNKLKESAFF